MLRELESCDAIFHAGDFNSMAVHELLSSIAPVYGVHGNNDARDVVEALPAQRRFLAGPTRLGLIHGHGGRGAAACNAFDSMTGEVDAVVFGHSHMPEDRTVNGLRLINPGSPTQRRRAPHRSYAIMTIDDVIRVHHRVLD